MLRKNLSIILIVLLAMLLIAMVIWVFNKRIESIGKKMKITLIHSKQFAGVQPCRKA